MKAPKSIPQARRALHWETAKGFAEKLAQIEREIEDASK